MPGVPLGFPFQLADEQLAKALDEMFAEENWPGFESFGKLGPELKIALVASGLQELQRREQAAEAKTALRLAYVTLTVSILAVIVAVITALTG